MDEEKPREHFKRTTFRSDSESDKKLRKMISDIEAKLSDSIKPESIENLNSFERKIVHRHFDHNKEFETRTYRNDQEFILYVYPVGNITRFAQEKAEECLESGNVVDLPAMGSYERYVVHAALKEIGSIETKSNGEGSERHIQIHSKKFGRGLKRIVRKIRLF